ncbi:hypothetical protein [Pseudofrankia sp. BMG5.37]|uniref:hypothetical protein n=1 Tax=Pseudofrankia sp. BMG5.37 TaxID=3050035 RepID=UPI0028938C1A|nr:hypothetical protein [Pseudofrankia sp. BMG5.37]MDT3445820.1 hypothetical protein [Pseudofrankia sp. BMG5.37]
MEAEWFETEAHLDEIQDAFVSVLRARATAWPQDPADTRLELPGETPGLPDEGVLAWIDILDPDPECHAILLTVGVYFYGDHAHGDEVHNQLLTLPDKPTPLAWTATGTPGELAERAADWFEYLLRRPVTRYEWMRPGTAPARRWHFGNPAPERIAQDWPRVGTLGPPDRVVHFQRDLPDAATSP